MKKVSLLVLLFSLSTCVSAQAQSAPESLRNRSFLINWSESRETETPTGLRNVSIAFRMTIYVSTAGRPFARLTLSSPRDTASQDTVGGSGRSLGNGVRTVSIRGNTLLVQSNFGGAARRVNVDTSGGACSAQVSVGMLQGSNSASWTRTDGRQFTIRSISAGSASCQASAGNTFAQ